MKPNLAPLLLFWYAKNKRDLPWRHTRDPYKIWVSEIMLQQTQVSRVIEYYERFLKRFPDVTSLSAANWEQFLPYWRGLGFYSRGRNMLQAAKMIEREWNGKFPRNKEDLEKLPGVAAYTSAAILSFAFGESILALDTNIKRVLQRVYGCTEKGIKVRAETLFQANPKHSVSLNHALMDLGATICQSRKVQCEICPFQKDCHFYRSGKKEAWEKSLSHASRKKIISTKIPMEVAVACIHRNGKYLICQRHEKKGGLWEFPGGKREIGEDWRHALKREIKEELDIEISVRPYFFEEVWTEKEYFWRLRFFRCQILKGTPKLLEHEKLAWVKPQELEQYEFPKANRKAIERLVKMKMTKMKN